LLHASKMASLHNHTDRGSLLDSILTVDELVEQAKEFGYSAVAITEHGTMHTFVDHYKKCKEVGIKPIIGVEAYETTDMDYKESDADRFHLLLLAKNQTGLNNLFKIVSESYSRGFYQKPRVDRELLEEYSEGIIATSSCLASRLMRLLQQGFCPCCKQGNNEHKDDCTYEDEFTPQWKEAKKQLKEYKRIFGNDFYLELQSHDTLDQMVGNQRMLQLARETNTKTILTFDSHMKDNDTKTLDIHAKFIAISQSGREVGETYKDTCQQPMERIYEIMEKQIGREALEEAIINTGELAEQCNIEIELGHTDLPKIEVPKGYKTEVEYLKHWIDIGWKERGLHLQPKNVQEEYRKRIEDELVVLEELGYIGYFLMLKIIITMIKENKIPYGYSRGSGGNCLVLWMIGVTEVDSIRWKLDFSRFANLGRKGSMADYDLDISKRLRWKVLQLTENYFGHDRFAHITTFNSLSAKVCIRDLGKIFHNEGIYDIPYKVRDKIAKMINTGQDIKEALEQSSEMKKYQKKYPLLFEYTEVLQNKPKSIGCHASAIIISNQPVTNYGPTMLNKDGKPMLQLEMGNAEEVGLLKFDYLGLNSLDVVDDTLHFIGKDWDYINLQKLNLNDQAVFDNIYTQGKTLGIFQMESYVAQGLCKEVAPNHVEDVFAINAMNRPAILSIGMQNVYIKNKRKPNDIEYLHHDLKPIFEPTYGIMLYQEQALQVLKLSGFSDSETDVGRRAIGKKKADVMEKLKKQFHEGLKALGWGKEQILELWNILEVQSTYSFNKGHSSSYGLLSYVMAYLKHYHPTAFMCALLISEIGDYEQTSLYMDECNQMSIKILPPNVNKSEALYTIGGESEILFGFNSIKGVGEKASEIIMDERVLGEFDDLEDFMKRCKLDIATVVAMIKSGAFGMDKEKIFQEHCKLTFEYKDYKPVKTLPTKAKLVEYGLLDASVKKIEDKEKMLQAYNDWKRKKHEDAQKEKFVAHAKEYKNKYMQKPEMWEFDTLSIFLNGSPYDNFSEYFKPFESYLDGTEKVLIGGTIVNVDRKKGKFGQYAYIEVLTLEGIYEGMCFSDVYTSNNDLIQKGQNIVALVKKTGEQFIVKKMKDFDIWRKEIVEKEKRRAKKEQ
jgi:DNA polymerase III subunit alpha